METTIHLRFAGARSAFRLPNGVKKAVGAKTAFVHPKIHRKSQTRGFQCDDCDGHMFYSLRQKHKLWDTVAVCQVRSLSTVNIFVCVPLSQLMSIQQTFSGIKKKWNRNQLKQNQPRNTSLASAT